MKRMTVAMLFCAFSVMTFVGCGGGEETKKTETKKTETKTEEKAK
ncbi:MAG: hypothetical protein JWM11_4130 [Planctomycetaceae bacterium]|nr:hypothetical protein [Planctomycetaceae bacterium]